MTDHAWVAIQRAVLAGLKDKDVVHGPPTNDQELEWVADTVADHVYSAIDRATRRTLAEDERRG